MAGGRAQPSGYNCPRTKAMRTAAVQGGGEQTLAQRASDILSSCMSSHEEKFERIAFIYIKRGKYSIMKLLPRHLIQIKSGSN